MFRLRVYFWMLIPTMLLQAATGYAASASPTADYSQAVSLFNAKNYQAALPLFQQVIQDDPGNAQAYYYLGSCQETAGYLRGEVLSYYISNKLSPDAGMKAYADKVMENLSPEDQAWVEKHFDAFAPPAVQSPAPSNGSYSQAMAFFDAKDYQTALPLFQQAIQDNPGNAKAYYYSGSCEKNLGNPKEAALDFYISDRLQPYPGLKSYADKLMANLSGRDQEAVKNRLAAWNNPLAAISLSPKALAAVPESRFGVRISTEPSWFNLSDFQSDLNAVGNDVLGYQSANPSLGYKFQSSIASSNVAFELNPYFTVGSDVELGIAFNYWPTSIVTFDITDIHPSYFVHSKWDVDTFELLFKGRFYFPKTAPKGIRFYAEPALGIQPISIDWTDSYQNTSNSPSTDQVGWNMGGTAFEAGLKLGMVVDAGSNFLFSFSGGYQLSAASGFQGASKDAAVPANNGVPGALYMFKNPSTGQSYILFIPSDPNKLSAFGENSSTINYCGPFTVDFSGFRLVVDASYTF